MGKIRGKLLRLIIVLCVLAFIVVAISYSRNHRDNHMHISLIVYDMDSRDWENLRQGAELACEGYDAEISISGASTYNNAAEQIDVIQREIDNGADALMIAACDSEAIGKYFDENKISIPVVFVNNSIKSKKNYDCISVDDYAVGELLGKSIIERENPIVKVAIISDDLEKEEVAIRQQGVLDVISPYVSKILVWERNEDEKKLITRKFIQNKLLEEAVDVVVALDNDASDALIDALLNLNRSTKAYVISTSDESVFYLDKGKIKTLEYLSEFEIGYMGAKYILDKNAALKDYADKKIKYQIVTKENMYDENIQTFIFPFVK